MLALRVIGPDIMPVGDDDPKSWSVLQLDGHQLNQTVLKDASNESRRKSFTPLHCVSKCIEDIPDLFCRVVQNHLKLRMSVQLVEAFCMRVADAVNVGIFDFAAAEAGDAVGS